MKLPVDIWLEIVKGQLSAGDSAVIACSKANIVCQEYKANFLKTVEPPMSGGAAAKAWFEELAKKEEQNEKAALSIPPSGYVTGDPNAR